MEVIALGLGIPGPLLIMLWSFYNRGVLEYSLMATVVKKLDAKEAEAVFARFKEAVASIASVPKDAIKRPAKRRRLKKKAS